MNRMKAKQVQLEKTVSSNSYNLGKDERWQQDVRMVGIAEYPDRNESYIIFRIAVK